MSHAVSPIAPVRKVVQVEWSPSEAFDRFTAGIASWWPARSHSVGQDRVVGIVFEAHEGGRLYEIREDGTTSDWGTVLACEIPSRLVFTWHPGREPDTAQQVEVSFLPSGSGTEVVLVHSGWEKLGEVANEARQDYDSGWEGVLRCFVAGSSEALAS